MKNIKFGEGAHSTVKFQTKFLTPLFEDGTIPEFPGADYYAICYGELYAYTNAHKYIAIWTPDCNDVPDCREDHDTSLPNSAYAGHWRKECG